MNAVDFIKKFGWGEAKRILRDARGCASVRLYDKYKFSTDDLNRYVDAWELVQSKGGLDKAKEIIAESFTWCMGGRVFVNPLEKAITLVEEVENANN